MVRDGLQCIAFARTAVSKATKLANILHQSALFRASFEADGKCLPATADTRWNSVYIQLRAICELDAVKLSALLRETSRKNPILLAKEFQNLEEVVSILSPFAEATDLAQGEDCITIGCVVPVLLALNRRLHV